MATIDLGKVVGEQGPQGEQGLPGPQGEPGPAGYGLPSTAGNVGEMPYTGTDESGQVVPLWGDSLKIKNDVIGAKSITGAKAINENENLDNLRSPGNYAAQTATIAGTLVNCPVSGAFVLCVAHANGTNAYISQEIIETTTGSRWYRVYRTENGVWSTWSDGSSDEVLPISKGGTGASDVYGATYNLLTGCKNEELTESTPGDNVKFYMRPFSVESSNGGIFYATLSSLWKWISAKVRSVFGFNASNVLGVENGGTGGTTVDEAIENLGVAKGGTVLFYDESVTLNSTITLSDSAENYDILDILFKDNDGQFNSTRVYNPNGKKVTLGSLSWYAGNKQVFAHVKVMTIDGSTISTAYVEDAYLTGEAGTGGTGTQGDYIVPYCVIGWNL